MSDYPWRYLSGDELNEYLAEHGHEMSEAELRAIDDEFRRRWVRLDAQVQKLDRQWRTRRRIWPSASAGR